MKSLENHFAELPHEKITQGYLAFDERGVEVRLRKVCEARLLVLTILQGDMRVEREIELTDAQFDELWPATTGRRLRKTRYWMPHDGLTVEIDVYKGHASRITVAAIEFPDRVSRTALQARLARGRMSERAGQQSLTFWLMWHRLIQVTHILNLVQSKQHNQEQFAIGRAVDPATATFPGYPLC